MLGNMLKPTNTGGPACARFVTDDFVHGFKMPPTVKGNFLIPRNQCLGELIMNVIGIWCRIDAAPRCTHGWIRHKSFGEFTR